jgi:glutaminyl-peptide cyclotransferase
MPHSTHLSQLVGTLLLGLTGCQGGTASPPETPAAALPFDGDRAWKLLVEQVELGPRPSGSQANALLRDWIVEDLKASGLTPVREPFTAEEAPGGAIAMENIYSDLEAPAGPKGAPAPMIVLGAHFDTKKMPFRFVGANDGASEVAVLLELARTIAKGPARDVSYRFLFLDGEEAVREYWEDPDNRYGSRYHVRQLTRTKGALKRTKAFILLDLVGDADLQLERDSNSNRELLQIFVDTSKDIGMPNLFARFPMPIKDDHQSFAEFGIPSVDLIDLRYGKIANEYWHTEEDTVDKCSQASLEKVGNLILAALPRVESRYGKH